MNKNNYNIDLIAGIDTLEVTTPTYLTDVFDFITHDNTRRVTQNEINVLDFDFITSQGTYKRDDICHYRYNADKTYMDVSTVEGYNLLHKKLRLKCLKTGGKLIKAAW